MAHTDRRTQIYLSEEQHRDAVRMARSTGRSLASIAREALAEYLARHAGQEGADWDGDPIDGLAGTLDVPALPSGESLDEAIDRSVYDG